MEGGPKSLNSGLKGAAAPGTEPDGDGTLPGDHAHFTGQQTEAQRGRQQAQYGRTQAVFSSRPRPPGQTSRGGGGSSPVGTGVPGPGVLEPGVLLGAGAIGL